MRLRAPYQNVRLEFLKKIPVTTTNRQHMGVQLALGEKIRFGDDGTADWVWSNINRLGSGAKLVIDEAGKHTVNLWMREDGVSIDKLIFSVDPSFDPSAINGGLDSLETARGATPSGPSVSNKRPPVANQ